MKKETFTKVPTDYNKLHLHFVGQHRDIYTQHIYLTLYMLSLGEVGSICLIIYSPLTNPLLIFFFVRVRYWPCECIHDLEKIGRLCFSKSKVRGTTTHRNLAQLKLLDIIMLSETASKQSSQACNVYLARIYIISCCSLDTLYILWRTCFFSSAKDEILAKGTQF